MINFGKIICFAIALVIFFYYLLGWFSSFYYIKNYFIIQFVYMLSYLFSIYFYIKRKPILSTLFLFSCLFSPAVEKFTYANENIYVLPPEALVVGFISSAIFFINMLFLKMLERIETVNE